MDQPGTLGYISGTILNTFSSLFNFSEKPMFNPSAGQNHCLSTHLTRHFEMFSSQKTCTIGSYQLCEGCSVCLSRESHSVYSFYTFYVKCSPMFQVHILGYLKVCDNVQWLTPSEEKGNQCLVLCSKNFCK